MEAVILMGVQAAGKSSFYRERFFATHLRLNLDQLHTRHRERGLLEACLQLGVPFVIDNTNPRKSDRQRYIPLCRRAGVPVLGYYVQVSLEEALRRNHERADAVPEAAIRHTWRIMETPRHEEGFSGLFLVRSDERGSFVITPWQ